MADWIARGRPVMRPRTLIPAAKRRTTPSPAEPTQRTNKDAHSGRKTQDHTIARRTDPANQQERWPPAREAFVGGVATGLAAAVWVQ